jgi:molybdate transport system ATP-binding protein
MMFKAELQYRRNDFTLDFKLEMRDGVLGLFGPSGAGKSTAIHLLAGLLKPTHGRVQLGETVLDDTAARVHVACHRRRVGVVFQDARLFPHLTVAGNLAYGMPRTSGQSGISHDDVIDLLALAPMLGRKPRTLSGGEQQRVAIGRALLSNPRLLLMDEPLVGLDRALKQQVLPMLRRVCDAVKLPIVYVSHDLTEVLQLTDQLLLIDCGRAIAQGSYLDLAQSQAALQRVLATGLVNVYRLRVEAVDAAAGWTQFSPEVASSPSMRGPVANCKVGDIATVLMRPEDVALATDAVQGISMQNQWRGTVTRVVAAGGQKLVEVDIGVPLLVEVTAGSFDRLALGVGRPAWCLAKSNALQVLSIDRQKAAHSIPPAVDQA